MAHNHGAHAHGIGRETDRRRLAGALALILALMAVELARIGAVGVIHRNMSPESQVEQLTAALSPVARAAGDEAKPTVFKEESGGRSGVA